MEFLLFQPGGREGGELHDRSRFLGGAHADLSLTLIHTPVAYSLQYYYSRLLYTYSGLLSSSTRDRLLLDTKYNLMLCKSVDCPETPRLVLHVRSFKN